MPLADRRAQICAFAGNIAAITGGCGRDRSEPGSLTSAFRIYNHIIMVSDDPLSRALAALADPTRRAILERLAAGEAGVVELAGASPVSQPAITRHLKVLERAGLIGRARHGQRRPARLHLEGLRPVDEWLRHAHAEWSDRLDRLEAHLAAESDATTAEESPDA
jgi:DNA-binding transcriptional ArsR family regulator